MANPSPQPKPESDRFLIDAVLNTGSELAIRTLVVRITPYALAVVQRLLANNETEAQDVMQDAWVKAISHLHEYRYEASLQSWVTRIAVRSAHDHMRRHAGRRWEPLDDDTVADATTGSANEQAFAFSTNVDLVLDLETRVARLPTGCRTVLVLHDIEGFTHEEISADLGIAIGTSKAHLFRARQLLRKSLSAYANQ